MFVPNQYLRLVLWFQDVGKLLWHAFSHVRQLYAQNVQICGVPLPGHGKRFAHYGPPTAHAVMAQPLMQLRDSAQGGKPTISALGLTAAGHKCAPIDGLWKSSPSYLFEKVPLTRAFDGTTF
jgi:hypothetical protein